MQRLCHIPHPLATGGLDVPALAGAKFLRKERAMNDISRRRALNYLPAGLAGNVLHNFFGLDFPAFHLDGSSLKGSW
jgi:hypothetical protein